MKHKVIAAIKIFDKIVYRTLFVVAFVTLLFVGFLPAMTIWSAGLAFQSVRLIMDAEAKSDSRQAFLLRLIGAAVAAVVLAGWNTPISTELVKHNIVVFCYAVIVLSNNHRAVIKFTEDLITAAKDRSE